MLKPTKKQLASSFKKSNNSTIITLMVVSMLVVSSSIIFGRKLFSDVRYNNRVLSAKRQADSALERNVETLPDLRDNFKKLEVSGPNSKIILAALPTTVDFPGFASSMELIANLSGVRLILINTTTAALPSGAGAGPAPAPAAAAGGDSAATTSATPAASGVSSGGAGAAPQEAPFALTVEGPYSRIIQFIKNLESAARPIIVTNVELNGDNANVRAELQLKTFYQDPFTLEFKKEAVQ